MGKEMLPVKTKKPAHTPQVTAGQPAMEEIHTKSPQIIFLNKNHLFFPLSHLSSLPACPESFTAQFIRIYFIFILSGFLPRACDTQNEGLGSSAHPVQGFPCSSLHSLGWGHRVLFQYFSPGSPGEIFRAFV